MQPHGPSPASSPRRTERDDALVGFNLASASAAIVGLGGFAVALAGDGQAWLTPMPWLLLGVGCGLAFIVGLFAARKFHWHAVGMFRSVSLALFAAAILSLTGWVAKTNVDRAAYAQSAAANEARLGQLLADLGANRAQMDADQKQINLLNQKQQILTQDQQNQLDELRRDLAERAKHEKELEKEVTKLKAQPPVVAVAPPASQPANPGGDTNPTGCPGNGGNPPAAGPGNGGPGSGGAGNGGPGNGGPGGGGTDSGGNGAGPGKGGSGGGGGKGNDPAADLMKAAMMGLVLSGFLPAEALLLLIPDLINFGTRVEDMPAVTNAVRNIVKDGKPVTSEQIAEMLKNCKDPKSAAKALERILNTPSIREKLPPAVAASLENAFKELKQHEPATQPATLPAQVG